MARAEAALVTDDARLLNRELSWLDYNARVLASAADAALPLLERSRNCAYFSSNLDEFFQVRVAGLKDQLGAGLGATAPAAAPAATPSEISTGVTGQTPAAPAEISTGIVQEPLAAPAEITTGIVREPTATPVSATPSDPAWSPTGAEIGAIAAGAILAIAAAGFAVRTQRHRPALS